MSMLHIHTWWGVSKEFFHIKSKLKLKFLGWLWVVGGVKCSLLDNWGWGGCMEEGERRGQ